MAGKYDTDGIDVAFLNSTKVGEGIRASIPLDAVNDPSSQISAEWKGSSKAVPRRQAIWAYASRRAA